MYSSAVAEGCAVLAGLSGEGQTVKSAVVSSGEKATTLRYTLMGLAAEMTDVISLGGGEPDLDTPPEIIETALRRMEQPRTSVPIRGLRELRQALADRYEKEKGLSFDPERQIVITNGAQEGLFLAMLALVNPGDKVLTPDPRYSSYDQAIGAAGGQVIEIPTGRDYRFELDPEDLRKSVDGSKILILVNPSNPTGALVEAEAVRRIAEVAVDTDLVVISDEIYDGLIYDGKELLSTATCEGMRDRTVTLSGFSKSYAMTGFRVGYLIGEPAFISAVAGLKQVTSGPCPLFSQYAALAALQQSKDTRPQFREIFDGRRVLMMEGLDSLGIPYGHPGGGLFMWADLSKYGMSAKEFCYKLLEESRVLMFPGQSFGEKWRCFVRISLVQPEEKISQALERITGFVEGLR